MVVSMDIREAGETIMRISGVAMGTDHKRQRSLRRPEGRRGACEKQGQDSGSKN